MTSRQTQPYIVTSEAHAARLWPNAPVLCRTVGEMLKSSGAACVVWTSDTSKGLRYQVARAMNAGDEEIKAK